MKHNQKAIRVSRKAFTFVLKRADVTGSIVLPTSSFKRDLKPGNTAAITMSQSLNTLKIETPITEGLRVFGDTLELLFQSWSTYVQNSNILK